MSIQPLSSSTPVAPGGYELANPAGKQDEAAVRGTPQSNRSAEVNVVEQSVGIAPVAQPEQANDPQALEEAVKRIREFVQPINDSIQFSLDDDTGRTIVKVIDLQTQEVLRQIPSEEVLNIAKALDRLQGLLIHNKA
jgi:flagellar protein FlaG